MKTKTDYKSILIEINILTIAIAIIAVAVYFFLVPSHTSISSMSGLGIVLSNSVERNSGLKQFTRVLCCRCFWVYLRIFFPTPVL